MEILKSKDEILRDVIPWEGINDLVNYLDESQCLRDMRMKAYILSFSFPLKKASETLHKHVRIYKLIDEFVTLSQDYHKCEGKTSKDMISKRLEEIVKELKSFIVFDMKVSINDQGEYR